MNVPGSVGQSSSSIQGQQNLSHTKLDQLQNVLDSILQDAKTVDGADESDAVSGLITSKDAKGGQEEVGNQSQQVNGKEAQKATFLPESGAQQKGEEANLTSQLEALAVLLSDDDEKNVKKKKKKSEFEKKLEEMKALEGMLMGVEFESEEEQRVAQQFFDTMDQIRKKQSQLRRLNHSIRKHEEILEQQGIDPDAEPEPGDEAEAPAPRQQAPEEYPSAAPFPITPIDGPKD